MLTVPRCIPSLLTNVMSRFFIWIVTGTSTVSLVTFTKSERTSNGIGFRMTLEFTTSSRSVNFTCGAAFNLAYCSRRSNSLVCSMLLSGPRPRRSMPLPVKRDALFDMPICSYMVKPAFGV